jgi:hypothetical protein
MEGYGVGYGGAGMERPYSTVNRPLFLAGRRLPTFYNIPELRRTLLHVRYNTAY